MRPPEHIVRAAVDQARQSPCAKSKRGAAICLLPSSSMVEATHDMIIGQGYNGPPPGITCDGSERCRSSCRNRCEHAESRAVLDALSCYGVEIVDHCELVHVKIGAAGELVAGGGPSCVPCAVRILDVGLGGVWLYETISEEWCPHLDQRRIDCPLCQGANCDLCHPGPSRPHCDHDVMDRHHGHPIVDARWRRYTAAEFHRLSCRAKGVY